MLQDDLYEYLQYVVGAYARRGIDPKEGLALFQLDKAVGTARAVDETKIAKLATDDSGNATLSVEPRDGDKTGLGPLQEVEHPLPPRSVTMGD
jgi:hypothetical protein